MYDRPACTIARGALHPSRSHSHARPGQVSTRPSQTPTLAHRPLPRNGKTQMPATDLLLPERDVRFAGRRRLVGLLAAPAVALLVLALLPANMNPQAGRLLALLFATLVLWVTEALPIAMTAVLAPALSVLVGIGTAEKLFAAFGNPLLFLFFGAFVMAAAAERTRLDRVLAARLFPHQGTSPERTLISATLVTAGISSLFSNTATTAMMVPVVRAAVERLGPRAQAVGVLTAAFASSIGGVLTPIGTPPNLLAIAALQQYAHRTVPFFLWTVLALPMAISCLMVWITVMLATIRRERGFRPASAFATEGLEAPHDALNVQDDRRPLDRGQRGTLLVIALAAVGWMVPGVLELTLGSAAPAYLWTKRHLPEGVVAVMASAMLFVLPAAARTVAGKARPRPVLVWQEAAQIDWGTILLFGGGLALGEQVFATGLSAWIGDLVIHATGVKSLWALTILFSTTALLLSEFTSNIATAAMLCPLAVMTSQQLGVSPVPPCVAAGLAASLGFLMPISNASNAIVFGTGRVPLATMMRAGMWLDVTGLVVIPLSVLGMTRWLGLE
jgi:sodium-dependent dicarboxylate transporter 2/3/5